MANISSVFTSNNNMPAIVMIGENEYETTVSYEVCEVKLKPISTNWGDMSNAISPILTRLKHKDINEIRDRIDDAKKAIRLTRMIVDPDKAKAQIEEWYNEIADLELQVVLISSRPLEYWIDRL